MLRDGSPIRERSPRSVILPVLAADGRCGWHRQGCCPRRPSAPLPVQPTLRSPAPAWRDAERSPGRAEVKPRPAAPAAARSRGAGGRCRAARAPAPEAFRRRNLVAPPLIRPGWGGQQPRKTRGALPGPRSGNTRGGTVVASRGGERLAERLDGAGLWAGRGQLSLAASGMDSRCTHHLGGGREGGKGSGRCCHRTEPMAPARPQVSPPSRRRGSGGRQATSSAAAAPPAPPPLSAAAGGVAGERPLPVPGSWG